ncbi:MAG TPA: hypothetical protein VE569_05930 [Acidimicrobiia bacterium]|nr:hypothetical protein [Acidimicrobiia bacterium]
MRTDLDTALLRALVVAFGLASILAVPALFWLYRLTQTRTLGEGTCAQTPPKP